MRRIVSFRNRLVHGYSQTDHEIVWGILEKDLPTLQEEVASLLAGTGTDSCTAEPSQRRGWRLPSRASASACGA